MDADEPQDNLKEEKKAKRSKEESKTEKKVEEKKQKKKIEEADESKEDVASHIDITKPKIAARTVCISGISEDVAYKQLLRKVKKFGKIEALMYPAAEGTDVAYVQYHGADQAATSLHKLTDGFSIGDKPTTVQMFSSSRVNRFRVIVRNLPFKCTEEILREKFSVFGDILQLDLPAGQSEGTIRGFGFVTYTNSQAANKAVIEGSKLKILGRTIAVDLTVGRDQVGRKPIVEDKTKDEINESDEKESKSDEKDSKKSKKDSKNSTSKSKKDSDDDDEDANDNDEDGDDDDDEESVEEHEELDPDDPSAWPSEVPDFETESEDSEDDGDEDSDDEEAQKKKREAEDTKKTFSTDVHLGQTLFLRNVAFDTTEEQLFDKFSEWGRLKHAKIVKDKQTGEAKGTAFIHFIDAEDAERCLKDAYASAKFAIHNRRAIKPGRNNEPSSESDIQVGGRKLIIATAVTRKSADKLTEEGKEKREKFGSRADRRNLGLAALSTLSQEAMAELSKDERDKYERGQHEKNTKLANPNFHVSRTRLCVRNLPKTMTEDQLRSMFTKASENVPGRVAFHQVKIVRDKERSNASRGYGFVEFSDHVHAKAALEAIHGKHHKVAKGNRLFVEFAVEDSRVLQAREFRLEKSKAEGKQKSLERAASEASNGGGRRENQKKRKREAGNDDAEDVPTAKRADGGDKRQRRDAPNNKRPKTGDAASDRRPKANNNNKRDAREKKHEDPIEKKAFGAAAKVGFGPKQSDGRRGSQSRKSEEALEKMIGQYKKSLESDPSKKRWFD